MEDTKPLLEGGSQKDVDEPFMQQECCCCCECCGCKEKWKESKGESFCCCFPLSLGISFWIWFFFIWYLVSAIVNTTLLFLNQYVEYYYPLVLFFLYIPLFVAFGIYCANRKSKTKDGRGKLKLAVLLVIISAIAATIWSYCYYEYLYDYGDDPDAINDGMGDKEEEGNLLLKLHG